MRCACGRITDSRHTLRGNEDHDPPRSRLIVVGNIDTSDISPGRYIACGASRIKTYARRHAATCVNGRVRRWHCR